MIETRSNGYADVDVDELAGNRDNGADDSVDNGDELTEIRGIGEVIAGKLQEAGICRYDQLASLTSADLDRILELVPDFEHRMKRYDYMQQALTLHSKKYNDHL
jgi:predicted flap endonuclease-1-like 5' DNA nuclease